MAAHLATQEIVNGEVWFRLPLVGPWEPCQCQRCHCDGFTFEGRTMQPGTLVTVFHATTFANLLGGSPEAEGSSGILNDRSFRSGCNGHKGRFGVFVHALMDGAGWYVRSSRGQWPAEPMCAVEARATGLFVVAGGMRQRYVATGAVGAPNPKIAPIAIWMWGPDVPARVPPPPSPPPPPPPPPAAAPGAFVPLPQPLPLAANMEVVASWAYAGRERLADGRAEGSTGA